MASLAALEAVESELAAASEELGHSGLEAESTVTVAAPSAAEARTRFLAP
jgi:hypothetical protein